MYHIILYNSLLQCTWQYVVNVWKNTFAISESDNNLYICSYIVKSCGVLKIHFTSIYFQHSVFSQGFISLRNYLLICAQEIILSLNISLDGSRTFHNPWDE